MPVLQVLGIRDGSLVRAPAAPAKEVSGKSPSKGQLPFSTDWFMTWQPNIHASLFLNIHEYLNKAAELDEIDTVIKAYQLYQGRPVPRAWKPCCR